MMTYLFGEALINTVLTIGMSIGFSFLGKPLKNNGGKYALLTVIVTVWTLIVVYFDTIISLGVYGPALFYFCFIVIYSVIFKQIIIRSIVYFAFALILGFLFESIVVFLTTSALNTSFEKIADIYWLRFSLSCSTVLFLVVLKIFVPFKRIFKPLEKHLNVAGFMLMNIMIFIVFSKPVMLGHASTFLSIISILPLFIFAMVTNYLIAKSLINDNRRTRKLKNYQNQKFTLGSVVKSDFELRHKFLADLVSLQNSIDENHISGASNYIDKVKDEISHLNTYEVWSNPLLAVLVDEYEKKAMLAGVVFTSSTTLAEHNYDIEEYELIEIVKGLLDNAFGGVNNFGIVESVRFDLKFDEKLYIAVKNRQLKNTSLTRKDSISSKKLFDSVEKIVSKYNGMMTIGNDDGSHFVTIEL